jgi:transcriptional regulator with PAS, ATPase and Fis domain
VSANIIIYSQNQAFVKVCNSSLPEGLSLTVINEFNLLSRTLLSEKNCVVLADYDCFRIEYLPAGLLKENHHKLYILSGRVFERRRLPENVLQLPFGLKNLVKELSDGLEVDPLSKVLTGDSPAMQKVRTQVREAAECDYCVLITGESGTGKTLAAEAIHNLSRRKSGNFVKENVSAISPMLIESELFGVKKGAYTDAAEDRDGLIMKADKGTLFLDETGELEYSLQSKLLGVVQDRIVRKVGSDEGIKADVRYIFATNQDLHQRIEQGLFRKDLYYRMSELEMFIPPLRERREDIDLLARMWLEKEGCGINLSPSALSKLKSWDWPGNIRELENVLARALVRAREGIISPDLIVFCEKDRQV